MTFFVTMVCDLPLRIFDAFGICKRNCTQMEEILHRECNFHISLFTLTLLESTYVLCIVIYPSGCVHRFLLNIVKSSWHPFVTFNQFYIPIYRTCVSFVAKHFTLFKLSVNYYSLYTCEWEDAVLFGFCHPRKYDSNAPGEFGCCEVKTNFIFMRIGNVVTRKSLSLSFWSQKWRKPH